MGLTAAGAGALALVAAFAGALQTSPAAAATAVPPKVTSAFTPNLIGVGGSVDTALSFTITNPNSSSLSAIGLTDTLPGSLSIDNPNGENGTCGSASVITANPGAQTISLSGGSLKAGASCTVSVSLIANQAGVVQNNTGAVSSSAGSANGDTETLTVLPPPTVSVTHIRNNAGYTFGQIVHPQYTCAQPADPAALSDCSAVDDLGNSIRSGGWLNTRSPGQHSLTVSATSADGLITDDTVNYTVLPDNRFTVSRLKSSGGTVTFALALPGPGRVSTVERVGRAAIGSYSRTVETKRTIVVHLRPSAAGQSRLPARITLSVSYTPKGGKLRTVTRRGIAVS
jgi:hypothetical protein